MSPSGRNSTLSKPPSQSSRRNASSSSKAFPKVIGHFFPVLSHPHGSGCVSLRGTPTAILQSTHRKGEFQMRPLIRFWLVLALLIACLPVTAQIAAVPSLMNFQGRLAKPDGTPVPDGT